MTMQNGMAQGQVANIQKHSFNLFKLLRKRHKMAAVAKKPIVSKNISVFSWLKNHAHLFTLTLK